MDIDTLHAIKAEERAYSEWERAEKNRILSITNTIRKQAEWRKHFNQDIAIYGLTPEQLEEINNTVY